MMGFYYLFLTCSLKIFLVLFGFYTDIKKVCSCISYTINEIQIRNIKISKNICFWNINKIPITKDRQNPF